MPTSRPEATVRVWTWPIRWLHWTLALSVLGCLWWHEGGAWHERLGYIALAASAIRLSLGVALTRADDPARFAHFVRGPWHTLRYAQNLLRGQEPRHVGHNPLGAWMILALLGCSLAAALSGALFVTDRFWGEDLIITWHAGLGWALAVLTPVHVAGAIVESLRHRENLLASMVHGRKRPPAEGDVPP